MPFANEAVPGTSLRMSSSERKVPRSEDCVVHTMDIKLELQSMRLTYNWFLQWFAERIRPAVAADGRTKV